MVSISNIDNSFAQPNSIIYSIVPTVAVGQQISDKPPNYSWNKLLDGTYNQLRLTFLGGSNLEPIQIQDPNITILLVIRDQDELGISMK